MAFVDDIKKYVDKGIEASKDAFSKAGTAATRFGDQSVKKVEKMQLSNRLKEQFAALGEAVYASFSADKDVSLHAGDESVSAFISKIDEIQRAIAERDATLKNTTKKV